jgi:hypothetical protein
MSNALVGVCTNKDNYIATNKGNLTATNVGVLCYPMYIHKSTLNMFSQCIRYFQLSGSIEANPSTVVENANKEN